MKRRLFTADATTAFHLLDRPSAFSTSPLLVTPVSIRSPSLPPRSKDLILSPASLFAKAIAAKGVSGQKRPASASPVFQANDDDDDDDTPLSSGERRVHLLFPRL